MPKQITPRGKERYYKPAKNIQDITTSHELTVTFRSVDSNLNYMLLLDILSKHYLDTDNQYIDPFTITFVDMHRDAIYTIKFYEIIFKGQSDNTFNYSSQKVTAQDFTISFHFNFYDIEFLLNKSKVLELGNVPQIIQKI